ncbi:MAG: hypothetical protein M3Q11_06115 [Pseudomonadota bacterium]|nr:hypothetical protein [Pseudomonadota bacterium]
MLRAWPLLLLLASCQPSPADGDQLAPGAPEAPAGPKAEPASPWEAAAARGVVLRAVGNEPGWFMEVDRGPAPALRATLDYGDRSIKVAHAQVLDGDTPGYRGTAADGTVVVVEVRRETCSDGMSDRVYEASVILSAGEYLYRGCGRFLNPIRP